ncbi:Uroporphyrinogen decarboxylase [Porphyridium purpureum]|uniref:Uroporphyrinogen decarboxylase n=1 Tax=Porphyridium purpureum TaxID=35688 RepID=A0A5J4Z1I0_PORPP|nr:Uroporphyrinogen decarboxylase [Porphyridium purpureum]|eukprot:POR0395..scf208_2
MPESKMGVLSEDPCGVTSASICAQVTEISYPQKMCILVKKLRRTYTPGWETTSGRAGTLWVRGGGVWRCVEVGSDVRTSRCLEEHSNESGGNAMEAFVPVVNGGELRLQRRQTVVRGSRAAKHAVLCAASPPVAPVAEGQGKILLDCARGNQVSRPPVWLMRQAGRYMSAFREYSDKYPFRQRSETPEIAIELSLQPWRAFQTDGVIMFSDILTPLPAIGIEFDIVKGRGPTFESPLRSQADVDRVLSVSDFDPHSKLPFVAETLSALRSEIGDACTLLGFVGCPWTLAAYATEGSSKKEIPATKRMMYSEPQILHSLLDKLADMVGEYACFQIESGAEVLQFFDSWAHHLTPAQYAEFSLPYTLRSIEIARRRHLDTPLIFFANGGAGKLELIQKLAPSVNVVGLDWATDMADARKTFGKDAVLQGNMDPLVLLGSDDHIKREVQRVCRAAGTGRHILNVGHGVVQGTPERAVGLFCEQARAYLYEESAAPAAAR